MGGHSRSKTYVFVLCEFAIVNTTIMHDAVSINSAVANIAAFLHYKHQSKRWINIRIIYEKFIVHDLYLDKETLLLDLKSEKKNQVIQMWC